MSTSSSESSSHFPPTTADRHFYDSSTALKDHTVAILAAFHELIGRELADNPDRQVITHTLSILQFLAEQDMEMAIEMVLGPEAIVALREELARNDAAAQTNGTSTKSKFLRCL